MLSINFILYFFKIFSISLIKLHYNDRITFFISPLRSRFIYFIFFLIKLKLFFFPFKNSKTEIVFHSLPPSVPLYIYEILYIFFLLSFHSSITSTNKISKQTSEAINIISFFSLFLSILLSLFLSRPSLNLFFIFYFKIYM